jgi:hypothetical protein
LWWVAGILLPAGGGLWMMAGDLQGGDRETGTRPRADRSLSSRLLGAC